MLETSARLLRLLALFQAQRYWGGAHLCERLGVTARTLRRDVDRLRSLGYPVNSMSGSAGGYQLGAGATIPPLLLDDDEAVAVAVGLRMAASGSVAGMEEPSLRALSKLQQVLPARLRPGLDALQVSILSIADAAASVTSATLTALAGACRGREVVTFRYRSNENVESRREAEPHQLVHTGRRWYLAAWDLGRTDWRTFRVDRIDEVAAAPRNRFTPRQPPEGDFAKFVARSISLSPYPVKATVEVLAPADQVAQRLPPSVAVVEPSGSETCTISTGMISLDMLAVWVGALGFEFRVKEPPELLERVRLIGERFRRAADSANS